MNEINDIQLELPLVALRGLTVLPDMIIHFDLTRKLSKTAVEHAMTGTQQIILVTQKEPSQEVLTADGLYEVGTVAQVKQITRLPNDVSRVLVEGLYKARLLEVIDKEGEYSSAVLEKTHLFPRQDADKAE